MLIIYEGFFLPRTNFLWALYFSEGFCNDKKGTTQFWQGWEFALSLFSSKLPSNRSRCTLKKRDMRDSLDDSLFHFQQTSNSLARKNSYFCVTVFHCFSPFYAQEQSLPSLFAPSLFFKERREWFPLSLFTKEWPWANRSRRSLQKNDRERIAPVALYWRVTVSDSLFSNSE